MQEGITYIKVRIMAARAYFDCWQKISNGTVVAYVDTDGKAIELPEAHEAMVLIRKPTDEPA